jgi:hypothetical protein
VKKFCALPLISRPASPQKKLHIVVIVFDFKTIFLSIV